MENIESKKVSSARKLVLGFDAGCVACSDLAQRIKKQADNKLEIRSLKDPRVKEWRERALGENAPWTPTLIEVEGFEVRAWTGWRMGVQLGRLLGPIATWRVMQALGEFGATPKDGRGAEEPAVAKATGGLTRGQFLKGVGGAATAVSILSGTSALTPRKAEAATVTSVTGITGTALVDLARRRAKSKDMVNVGGQRWADGMQTGAVSRMSKTVNGKTETLTIIHHDPTAGSSSKWYADGRIFVDEGDTLIRATKQKLSDGNTVTAISYQRSNQRVMHYYRYASLVKRVRTEAALWRYDSTKEQFNRARSSHNGRLDKQPATTAQTQGEVTTQSHDPCLGCCYYYNYDYYYYYGYYLNPYLVGTLDFACVGSTITNYCTYCIFLAEFPLAGPGAALGCFIVCDIGAVIYCDAGGGEACYSCSC